MIQHFVYVAELTQQVADVVSFYHRDNFGISDGVKNKDVDMNGVEMMTQIRNDMDNGDNDMNVVQKGDMM